MPRQKSLVIGVLNIKTIHQSKDIYIKLLDRVYQAENIVKIRGADWGTIGWLKPLEEDNPQEGLIGLIYRFLNIDPREPWYDVNRRKRLDAKGDDKIPVPDSLKPNLRESLFIFFPKGHRLIFDTNYISPRGAQTLFSSLFSKRIIFDEFGTVDTIIETDKDSLSRIYQIPKLTRLEIHLTRPNPDDLNHNKQRLLKRFETQRARSWQQNFSSPRGEGLIPDSETKALMELAQSDGKVYAVGYGPENDKIEESTEAYPLKQRTYYHPKLQSLQDVFIAEAKTLLQQLRQRHK
jgi:hypothetical protein